MPILSRIGAAPDSGLAFHLAGSMALGRIFQSFGVAPVQSIGTRRSISPPPTAQGAFENSGDPSAGTRAQVVAHFRESGRLGTRPRSTASRPEPTGSDFGGLDAVMGPATSDRLRVAVPR